MRSLPHLHSHVADDHPARNIQALHIASGKVNGLINSAVRLYPAQDIKDDILWEYSLRRFSFQTYLNYLRNPEPQLPVIRIVAISVAPQPVPMAPKAPWVVVWLSVATIIIPG